MLYEVITAAANGGRLFTIVLIIMGAGAIVYALTASAEYLLAADLGPSYNFV